MTPDCMVQCTELEDGTRVRVNFGITSFPSGDLDLPPKSLSIDRPGMQSLTALASRKIEYLAHG